jgi:amino-acid N-acetyltransferase
LIIRKAIANEIIQIHKLLSGYAEEGLLLPRSRSELYDHLRDFFVISDNGNPDSIIAVCALGVCWENLAEIRSLAVKEEYQGRNYGAQLVKKCLNDAKSLGLTKVFTLTYVPEFFRHLGFKEVEKSELPHKIWADCLKCPKFPDCDEIALVIDV